MWSFDEASCCQLVYLYAEIAQRYSGEIHKFFELKGHVRPEEKEEGYEGNSLTIGSIDIGAGTTDIMICSYQCKGQGRSMLTPPFFFCRDQAEFTVFPLLYREAGKRLIQNRYCYNIKFVWRTQGIPGDPGPFACVCETGMV